MKLKLTIVHDVKGVWLDRGEINKIANIQNRYEDAHYQKYYYGRRYYDDDNNDNINDDYYDSRRKKGNSLKTYFILIN